MTLMSFVLQACHAFSIDISLLDDMDRIFSAMKPPSFVPSKSAL